MSPTANAVRGAPTLAYLRASAGEAVAEMVVVQAGKPPQVIALSRPALANLVAGGADLLRLHLELNGE